MDKQPEPETEPGTAEAEPKPAESVEPKEEKPKEETPNEEAPKKKKKKGDKAKKHHHRNATEEAAAATSTPTTTTTETPEEKKVEEKAPEEKKTGKKEDVEVDDTEYYGKIRLDDDEVLETDADRVVVSLRNIHKTYLLGIEGVPALRGVTATIYKGEFVCIFGTSGGGKTTMLNIIGTIDRPSKGDIFLCGTHITPRTPDKVLSELRLSKMGFVFQTFNLLSAMTAVENVELPMILRGNTTARERRKRAMELLKRVGMDKRANHLPSQLSGGEQQRVTIARAMANNPDILLLDEPTGDLDTHNTAIAMKLLSDLHKQGVTLIMVTHDVNLKYFADRIIWMRDGLVQRIEHTTPIQRKDCVMRMEQELSRKKKKTTKDTEPEFEVRQPESYEPIAYAVQRAQKNEEEQKRLMASLGLPVDTPAETTGKEIEKVALKKKKKDESESEEEESSEDDDDDDSSMEDFSESESEEDSDDYSDEDSSEDSSEEDRPRRRRSSRRTKSKGRARHHSKGRRSTKKSKKMPKKSPRTHRAQYSDDD